MTDQGATMTQPRPIQAQIPPRRRCQACAQAGTRCNPWFPCERCTTTGTPSELDHTLCSVCLPRPEIAASLEGVTRGRVRMARAAASDPKPATRLAVPPDVNHIWLQPPAWGAPHLFHVGETESYCAKVATQYPVELSARPALETVPGCRACWWAFEAGHRRPV